MITVLSEDNFISRSKRLLNIELIKTSNLFYKEEISSGRIYSLYTRRGFNVIVDRKTQILVKSQMTNVYIYKPLRDLKKHDIIILYSNDKKFEIDKSLYKQAVKVYKSLFQSKPYVGHMISKYINYKEEQQNHFQYIKNLPKPLFGNSQDLFYYHFLVALIRNYEYGQYNKKNNIMTLFFQNSLVGFELNIMCLRVGINSSASYFNRSSSQLTIDMDFNKPLNIEDKILDNRLKSIKNAKVIKIFGNQNINGIYLK